jgi:hypothetical protein
MKLLLLLLPAPLLLLLLFSPRALPLLPQCQTLLLLI